MAVNENSDDRILSAQSAVNTPCQIHKLLQPHPQRLKDYFKMSDSRLKVQSHLYFAVFGLNYSGLRYVACLVLLCVMDSQAA